MRRSYSQAEIKKSLKASLWDGAGWSLTVGFAEIYFSPFGLFLGATNIVIGLLSTLPPLIGTLSQLATSFLVKKLQSRKRLVLMGVAGQALLLFAMSATPLFGNGRLWFLFGASTLYWVAWWIMTPAWQSWMGDLVSEGLRGRYFARRNRIIQVVTFLALLAGGWILNYFQHTSDKIYWGFFTLLMLGGLGRIFSLVFINRQTEIHTPAENPSLPSFLQFIRKIPHSSFGLFVLFMTAFSAAVNLSAPYFIPYFLQKLHFTYLEFMGLIAVLVASKFFCLPLWGRWSDSHGSRKVLIGASLLFSLNPFLLLFSSNYYFLMLVQVFGGFGTAGFDLSSFNYLLDHTHPEERTRYAAYYEALAGIGIVAGSLLGGLILTLPFFGTWAYFSIFLISGIFRLLFSLGFIIKTRKD